MLHALRAKGASRHARAHHLTSNFSKKFLGRPPGPPTAGWGTPSAHSPLSTSCLALRIIFQALAMPLSMNHKNTLFLNLMFMSFLPNKNGSKTEKARLHLYTKYHEAEIESHSMGPCVNAVCQISRCCDK
jgi:hypothetical protein